MTTSPAPGGGKPSRLPVLQNLSLSGRAARGLGFVFGLLFCAVVIAGVRAQAARTAAEEMRTRRLPFMETAHALEGLVYEAAFHTGMFGVSGDMASYSGARIEFANIRAVTDRLAALARDVPEGNALSRDLEVLADLAARLDLVVEKKRTLNEELAAKQAELRKTADDAGEILLDLQARLASARAGKGSDISLDEKARLLVLNGFSLTVAELTGRVLAAGAVKSAEDIARAQAHFTVRWEEAREACVAAAALPSPEGISTASRGAGNSAADLETLAGAYADLLGTIRFNLEENARVTADRERVTGNLLSLTRGLVTVVREGMGTAADNTESALRGVVAILAASALLACVLAMGAAVVYRRSRSVT